MQETVKDYIGDLIIETADIPSENAVLIVAEPGKEAMLKDMLATLSAYGDVRDASVVLFCVNEAYDAMEGFGDFRVRVNSSRCPYGNVRTLLYAAHRALRGPVKFLTLESDMLIVGSLRPLWDILDRSPLNTLAGIQPMAAFIYPWNLIVSQYSASVKSAGADLMAASENSQGDYHFNSGVLLGRRQAWQCLEQGLEQINPDIKKWISESGLYWGEEAAMNLAVNQKCTPLNLDRRWNQMFYNPDPREREIWAMTGTTLLGMVYHGEHGPSRILHFPSVGLPMQQIILDEIRTHGLNTQGVS